MKHKVEQDYRAARAKAYPTIEEQLDTLYHKGEAAWKDIIAEVKQRFPKPAE